jgi:hypothetical protein
MALPNRSEHAMEKSRLQMILSSPLVEDAFRTRVAAAESLPRHRALEYIMAEGVRQENEKSFVAFAADVMGVSPVDLSALKPDEALAGAVPFKVAMEYRAAPLSLGEGVLEIACLDPLDSDVVDDVEILTGYRVKARLCGRAALDEYLSRLYRRTWQEPSFDDAAVAAPSPVQGPDVFQSFLGVVEEAVRQGAEYLILQPAERGVDIFFCLGGVEQRAYVPPLVESNYRELAAAVRAKAERLRQLSHSSVYHIFVNRKPVTVRFAAAATHRGDLLRVDIPANAAGRVPSLDMGYFTESEMLFFKRFRPGAPGLLFVACADDRSAAFFLGLAEMLGRGKKRCLLLEDGMLKKAGDFFHADPGQWDLAQGGLDKALRPFAPGLVAVRSEKLVPLIHEMAGASCILGVPFVMALPLRTIGDMLSFISRNVPSEAIIYYHLLEVFGMAEPRAFRTVCPACSREKQVNPVHYGLLGGVREPVVTVREAGACGACRETGYADTDFIARTWFLEGPSAASRSFFDALQSDAAKTLLRVKAAERILKRQTTLQEMERILA